MDLAACSGVSLISVPLSHNMKYVSHHNPVSRTTFCTSTSCPEPSFAHNILGAKCSDNEVLGVRESFGGGYV